MGRKRQLICLAAAVAAAAILLTASAKKSGDVTELQIGVLGTLTDGSVFDSSYDRGDPFEFTLGNGQVIKGGATLIFETELIAVNGKTSGGAKAETNSEL
ncbi:hypothetical protein BAE44_0018492 [Dichanthelium oligosanthes]|uniref:peptidylprolyl isomerase n=1 Tax=Dichanthelium oligosanthes TaxID=888268 RepID=A0A1E5V5Q0_9POAL|nr:hypothetical protein BAE44_0018492 [Dichanthelium oligosanthes]